MICPKCQTVNEDSAKFCGHCGEPLSIKEEEIISADIGTKLKAEKSSPGNKTLPLLIVLAIVLLAALFFFMKGCNLGSKKVECSSKDDNTFKETYVGYEKNGKVNKVYLSLDEIDDEGILAEEDVELLKEMMEEDKKTVSEYKGITMNYDVKTGDQIQLHVDVKLELDKIDDSFMGSMFIPYNPQWKEMTLEEFKEYFETYANVTCE